MVVYLLAAVCKTVLDLQITAFLNGSQQITNFEDMCIICQAARYHIYEQIRETSFTNDVQSRHLQCRQVDI